MFERVYEGMFLLDANRYSRDSTAVSTRLTEMIEKCGGSVLVSRLWAEQKLAYQIRRHRKGAYWLTYFRMDGSRIGELTRAGQLNNDVTRALFIAVDPRLVDTLVAHAGGSEKEKPPETKPAATESADQGDAKDEGKKSEGKKSEDKQPEAAAAE